MDRFKFTTIAHATHAICAPVSLAAFEGLIAQVGLSPGDAVLDIGCGKAAMLIRLLQRYRVRGVGADINAAFLEQAQQDARHAGVDSASLELHCQPAREFVAPGQAFALALCVGATQAFDNFHGTLTALHACVHPGGFALIGECFWQRPPHPDYLSLLGAAPETCRTHEGNLAAAAQAGWRVVESTVSTAADWDGYEDRYAANVKAWAAAHDDDPDSTAFLARIKAWRAAYLAHGQDTLGFALYLLKRA